MQGLGQSAPSRISFYTQDAPSSLPHAEILRRAGERAKLHDFVERYHRLPSDIFPLHMDRSLEMLAEDRTSHFALRIISCLSAGRAEEFVSAEAKVFRMRLEAYGEQEVLHFFFDEYLPKLQELVTHEIRGDTLLIYIDPPGRAGKLNWRGAARENLKEAMALKAKAHSLLRTKKTISADPVQNLLVTAHFTKLASLGQGQGAMALHKGLVTIDRASLHQLISREFDNTLSSKAEELQSSGLVDERFAEMHSALYATHPHPHSSPGLAHARKYFPPCISAMMGRLQRERHLKYQDRMTLATFLKDIGLTLEESLDFWRAAFSGITREAFDKEYRYRIRHVYAQEGSKIDYRGYPCTKIISDTGVNSCVGCPQVRDIEDPITLCTKLLSQHTGKKESPIRSPTEFYTIYYASASSDIAQ